MEIFHPRKAINQLKPYEMATKSNKQPLSKKDNSLNEGQIATPDIRSNEKPTIDWKQHPAIIAATSFGAGLFFYSQLLAPVTTARLDAKLELQSEEIKKIDSYKSELEQTKKQFAQLNTSYQTLVTKNPFRPNSLYPHGYDDIRIGKNIADIKQAPDYKQHKSDDPKNNYFSFERKIGIFESVTVYEDTERGTARSLLYFTNIETPGVLTNLLTENFGEPTFLNRRGEPSWKFGDKWIELGLLADKSYSISTRPPIGYK